MRSQLSGRWFSSNWVGSVVVLFYFSNLGEEEEEEAAGGRRQEAGYKEEGDVCLACNKETTGVKPPPRALLGLTETHVAMQETHSSDFSLALSCLRSENMGRNTVDFFFFFLPLNQRSGIHMLQP